MLKISKQNSSYSPSNEERFVQYYLENNQIKFIPQFRLDNLKGDNNFLYRDVDFYLPRLNVCVEYYGWYNKDKKSRNNYDLKTQVYIKNNIPTIIIYPHELGFIDYAFHTKMTKLLKMPKFRNWKKTFLYKSNRYLNDGKPYYLIFALMSFILGSWGLLQSKHEFDIYSIIWGIGFASAIYFFYTFFREIYYILIKNE